MIELSSSGGEYETSKGSLFRSGKISYLGGVVVTYMLIDKDGKYLNSGFEPVIKAESYKSLIDVAKREPTS